MYECSDASVEWNFLFPLCVTESFSFNNKYGINGFKAILSLILDMARREIGLYKIIFSWPVIMLGNSSKFPSFNIGETLAILQERGKIPGANEAFINDVKFGSTARRLSLITRR